MELHWIVFCLHSYSGPSWSFKVLLHPIEARVHCVCAGTWAVPSDRVDVSLQQASNMCFPPGGKLPGKYFIHGLSPSQTRVCTLLHLLKTQFSSAKRHCHRTDAGGWRRTFPRTCQPSCFAGSSLILHLTLCNMTFEDLSVSITHR